jgi:endonuclease-3
MDNCRLLIGEGWLSAALTIGNRQLAIRSMRKVIRQTKTRRPKESLQDKKHRARKILAGLHKLYPEADCALSHRDPLQLLIATILSAQSTDETVNKVTPVLFQRFPTARDLAEAPREEVERIVHSTGFFRQKTKSIQGACRKIVEEFGGKVPDTLEQLVTLPGVARKTANVVLGTAFGKNEGVVVDTHVGRLATRLGLTWTSKDGKDAVKIERDLIELIPQDEWTFLGHALIWHGRRVCFARKPNCHGCRLSTHCPSAGAFDDAGCFRGRVVST